MPRKHEPFFGQKVAVVFVIEAFKPILAINGLLGADKAHARIFE
jgi:hypothetical protein